MKVSGIVKRHLGRGRKLGFPTANLEVETKLEDGIYLATVGPTELPALVFLGAAKTFGDTERKVEVYILDFDEDIYGEQIEVEILNKLRDNRKFRSEEELIKQMGEDEKQARQFFHKPE